MSRLVTFAAAVLFFNPANPATWVMLASQVYGADQDRRARRDRRRAVAAYNAGLQDRLEMVERDPRQPRSLVLGRVRTVEGVRRSWQSGTHSEKLTLVVSFAGHEIDAFEQFYLDDVPVTLDGSGYVTTAPWTKTNSGIGQEVFTLDGSGGGAFTVGNTPVSGTINAVGQDSAGAAESPLTVVSVVGSVVTVSGGTPAGRVTIGYEYATTTSLVRIRSYLGTSTQNVGADLAAEYPGEITATDRFAGIALAVLDLTFDTDVFPQGRPTLTAVLRGAKLYDATKDTTAGGSGAHRLATPSTWEWSESSALCSHHYARASNGWAVPADEIRTADVQAAVPICAASTVFTMRLPDTSTTTATLPRYRCGMVCTGEDPRGEMDAIIESMNGRLAWAGGELRMRAGAKATAAFAINSEWFMQPVQAGEVDTGPVIQAAQAVQRDQRINRVTGQCVDPAQRYQMLPFPAVEDAVLIAAKGERTTELSYPAVTHIAHAQHLASMAIREAQAGLRLDVVCGLQALGAEVLDVCTLDLARYGFTAKAFEVVGWQWAAQAVVRLQLAEITDAMFTVDAELTGRDPAPDSGLRRPWDVEQITGLVVDSGTTDLLDGTIITRTVLTWDAAVGQSIRQGGDIEVQYTPATDNPPAGDWPSWPEAGSSTKAVIPGLLADRFYIFRARAVQKLPLVRGAWSESVVHQIAGIRGPVIYRQASAPSAGVQDGDEWFDTDDGNKHYVREAAAWVSVRDGGIAQALSDASAAQATADGKIDSYWQTTAPGSASEGDIWFDTDAGNKQYRYTSGSWVAADDTRIGQAISDASTAQATADGKVVTFVATSAPTAEGVGDLWLDTDDGNKLYRWSGVAWVALEVGTAAIAADAATSAGIQSVSSGTRTRTPAPGDGGIQSYSDLLTDTWTNSTSASVKVEVTYSVTHEYSGTGNHGIVFALTGGATETVEKQTSSVSKDSAHTTLVTVASGDTLTMKTRIRMMVAEGQTATVTYSNAFMRWAALKR